jgi:sigma-E factor negative regulatory protein RseA
MNQKISDLMDGEVDSAQVDQAWKAVVSDAAAREAWDTYHLIGDCMRGDAATRGCSRTDRAERIFARLAEEPTVLAPRRSIAVPAVSGRARIALAMAASVATLGVVGMIATRAPESRQDAAQVATQQVNAGAMQQVANGAPVPQVNDYLALHRQFANPSAIQPASLVREVSREVPKKSDVEKNGK